jgi:hypothetical protein
MKHLKGPHGFWIQEGRNTWLLLMLVAGVIWALGFAAISVK